MYTDEEVEYTDAEHVKRDADVSVVVEPVVHAHTQASRTNKHAHIHTRIQTNK